MFESWMGPAFWTGLLQVIGVNIILSGDNAVVIALAARALPPLQQRAAILIGSAGAIILRVILTSFAAVLLQQPFLKLIGSVLLLWIAIKLLLPEDDGAETSGHGSLAAAIRTIVIADFVMSLDNVLGVAAAAHGDLALLVLGLLISMPLIIFGSTLVLKMMERLPVLITLGAALLGYVAGEMGVADEVVEPWIDQHLRELHTIVPILGAFFVVIAGRLLAHRRGGARETG